MRESRRMKRMERNNKKHYALLNLIPMLDILSVLVFFLLFHSFNGTLPEQRLTLPESVAEKKPRTTLAISVTPDAIMILGKPVIRTAELYDDRIGIVPEITNRLEQIQPHKAGVMTVDETKTREITLLADKTIPFKIVKKIMTSCTASGYGKISLAVIEKAEHS
jgi:biopolymer transport protein TolR